MSLEAWLMCPDVADQTLPNRREPNVPFSLEDLFDLGVLHWKLDPNTMLENTLDNGTRSRLDYIMSQMEYKNRDEVKCSPDHLENYDAKLKMFFTEHIHEDEEVRLIKDGVGYFDVRNRDDEWVRIQVNPGDLIILPAGIYHRFTMTDKNWTHAVRCFKEAPKWTPVNRPCEDNEYRKAYVEKYLGKAPLQKPTVLGMENGTDNIYVHRPETEYDTVTRDVINSKLSAERRDLLVQYFTGTVNPLSGVSWCPDCVSVSPKVAEMMKKVREAHPDRKVVFMQIGVLRSAYLNNENHFLVKHPFVQLRSVPTLLVLQSKGLKADDDEEGVDVVYRSENPTDEWIDKLQAPKGTEAA